jgi:hypothetical protein
MHGCDTVISKQKGLTDMKAQNPWQARVTPQWLAKHGLALRKEVAKPNYDGKALTRELRALRAGAVAMLATTPWAEVQNYSATQRLRERMAYVRGLLKYRATISWTLDGQKIGTSYLIAVLRERVRAKRKHAKANASALVTPPTGRILGLYLRKNARLLDAYKRPEDDDTRRHVGVELEFLCPADPGPVRAALVPWARHLHWHNDGSVRELSTESARGRGFEVSLVAPLTDLPDILRNVCRVLTEHGCQVNTTCGLHVHLDQRGRDAGDAYGRLFAAQQLLFATQPKSRQKNKYCKRNQRADLEREPTRGRHDAPRYRAINKESLHRHTTIEVRCAAGSLDAEKIGHWVDLLHTLTDAESVLPTDTRVNDLHTIGAAPGLVAWVKQRCEQFQTVPQALRRRNAPRQSRNVTSSVGVAHV